MTITRRQALYLGAAAIGATAVGTTGLGAVPSASAQTQKRTWLLPYSTWRNLSDTSLGGDLGVCQNAFNQGTTWFSTNYQGNGPDTNNPVPSGYSGIGVLKFQAYKDGSTGLIDAITAGLPSWVQAVQYDAESWSQTPATEQGAWLYNQYPQSSYAQLFCGSAHQHGLGVVLTPGNDLCNNNPNPAYPNEAPQYPLEPGESNHAAYLRYDLASAAQWLSAGDIYEYQAQPLELNVTAYQSVTSQAAQQAAAVSSGVAFLAGIGRTADNWDSATCDQLTAAANSVADVTAGFWPNVDADATRVQTMICVLQKLGY